MVERGKGARVSKCLLAATRWKLLVTSTAHFFAPTILLAKEVADRSCRRRSLDLCLSCRLPTLSRTRDLNWLMEHSSDGGRCLHERCLQAFSLLGEVSAWASVYQSILRRRRRDPFRWDKGERIRSGKQGLEGLRSYLQVQDSSPQGL